MILIMLLQPQTQGNRRAPPASLPKKSYTNKRIERKLMAYTEKLSPEELMESGVYQRFNRAVEKIFDNTEDLDVTVEIGEEVWVKLLQNYINDKNCNRRGSILSCKC